MLDFLASIGIVAGAIIGLGVIWTKGALPLYRFLRKMEQVHDIILEFPEWKETVDHGLTAATNSVDHLSVEIQSLTDLVQAHMSDTGAHQRISVE